MAFFGPEGVWVCPHAREPHAGRSWWPMANPMAERGLPGCGTARAAKTRKNSFIFSCPKSGLMARCQWGSLCHGCGVHPPFTKRGVLVPSGLRAWRLPSPLLLPALAGVAAMESPGRARPRVVYIPWCLCAAANCPAWCTHSSGMSGAEGG